MVGFEDGVVRALNFHEKDERDVHGRKVKDSTELALKQAFKPHSGKVAAMAIDSKAEVLATGVSRLSFSTNIDSVENPFLVPCDEST